MITATRDGQKERPVIFSAPMVRAILDGRKTQTRRIVKPQPICRNGSIYDNDYLELLKRCPHGVAGDRFYVKETHYRFGRWVKNGRSKIGRQKWRFKIEGYDEGYEVQFDKPADVYERTGKPRGWLGWHKRPAIFLPKKLARTWLEIVKVRVERLQDISEEDAMAEGIEWNPDTYLTCKGQYHQLWDSLYGKGAWEKNPWVWCLEFQKARKDAGETQ